MIQIARKLGVRTVNVVRGERDDLGAVRDQLMGMGADHVLTEQELRKTALFRDKEVPRYLATCDKAIMSIGLDEML